MSSPGSWEKEVEPLASASFAAGDPTGWFDQLYAAGASGRVQLPWSRFEPHPLLTGWAQDRNLTGTGRRAVVVGCGLGADAEYLASLGFDTLGFDISETAIQLARERFPESTVRYLSADLLDLPADWIHRFDLVAEIITVQALPDPPRRQAITQIARLVAPGGTLLVIAAVRDDDAPPSALPPWPLQRAEIDAFGADGLTRVRIEIVPPSGEPADRRWRAEFHRPSEDGTR